MRVRIVFKQQAPATYNPNRVGAFSNKGSTLASYVGFRDHSSASLREGLLRLSTGEGGGL